MKTYFFPSLTKVVIVLLAFGFSACTEETSIIEEEVIENVFEEPFALMEVDTKQPDVGADVLFKGELLSMGSAKEVEYGFMWYDPNATEIVVTEEKVGVTKELVVYDLLMTRLPDKPKLVVCSYARVSEAEETAIGNEIEFDPSL